MDCSSSTCPSATTASTTSSTKLHNSPLHCTFLIVGGGIAGVSCAETIKFLAPNESTIVLSESSLIKSVTNLVQLGKYVTQFDVKEIDSRQLAFNIVEDKLASINSKNRFITTAKGQQIHYKHICLCTGARPKLIPTSSSNIDEFLLGIRDTDSVREFQKRIKNGNKFVLVGNGGIASEIAYEIDNIEIDWIIKDEHISSTFIDEGAAKFFESRLVDKESCKQPKAIIKRMRYTEEPSSTARKGAALGPDWHRLIDMSGRSTSSAENIKFHFGTEIAQVSRSIDEQHSIVVELTNGVRIQSDFIISATGVLPQIDFTCDAKLQLAPDGGIAVDELMRTSVEGVFAAGDVCSAAWEQSKFWHQMRLWTQARQMGMMAGKSMTAALTGEQIYQDFCFELFSHVTKLYGYQLVLLGRFNGQGYQNNEIELLFRITPNREFVKFVLRQGRLVGALLIGETGLEETCENLILNEIDLTPFGDDILNPNIDIEDYFD